MKIQCLFVTSFLLFCFWLAVNITFGMQAAVRNLESMLSSIRFYCYLFLVLGVIPLQASSLGGLKFRGSEQPIDQRTSYTVFGGNTAEFRDLFNIEFNLSLYPTTEFGYIVRIKNKESNRIYNL